MELALGLGVLVDPTKLTLRFEMGNCWVVSLRVMPVPFLQTFEVPAAPAVNMTPAHYGQLGLLIAVDT